MNRKLVTRINCFEPHPIFICLCDNKNCFSCKGQDFFPISSMTQFENVLLKYMRIFNILGESCVISSDFKLSVHSNPNRAFSYLSIFLSIFLTLSSLVLNIVLDITYDVIEKSSNRVVFWIFTVSLISVKIVSVSQLNSLMRLLPIIFNQLKEIHSLAEYKYDINFQQIQVAFHQGIIKIFGFWLISLISDIIFKRSLIDLISCSGSCLAMFIIRITICHILFYFILLQNMISVLINYVEQKAANNKATLVSELRIELLFIKINHFKLYEISSMLNEVFGWTLVSIFIHEFINFINAMTWMFTFIDCANIYPSFRKFSN